MVQSWPNVSVDEGFGELRVHDPRVFRTARRAFCERWLDATVRRPGVRRASVDLDSATVRVDFDPGSVSTALMALAFSDTVREALEPGTQQDHSSGSSWVALTAFEPGSGSPAEVWEVVGRARRRLRLRHRGLRMNPERLTEWVARVGRAKGVAGCRVRWLSDEIAITFDPESTNELRLIETAQDAWLAASVDGPAPEPSHNGPAIVPMSRWHRGLNLMKAGGAMGLTLVGLAVPGVPTVPFLLLTSYYLARSSPRLNEALRNSAFLGPIVREWETFRGLSPESKRKLTGLTVVIVIVSITVTPLSAAAIVLILLISSVSIYEISRLPGTPSQAPDGHPAPASPVLSPV